MKRYEITLKGLIGITLGENVDEVMKQIYAYLYQNGYNAVVFEGNTGGAFAKVEFKESKKKVKGVKK